MINKPFNIAGNRVFPKLSTYSANHSTLSPAYNEFGYYDPADEYERLKSLVTMSTAYYELMYLI